MSDEKKISVWHSWIALFQLFVIQASIYWLYLFYKNVLCNASVGCSRIHWGPMSIVLLVFLSALILCIINVVAVLIWRKINRFLIISSYTVTLIVTLLFGYLWVFQTTRCGKPVYTCRTPKPYHVGQQARFFTANDVGGKPVSLDGFKGKYVLLHFWATWCGPCRAEIPQMQRLYEGKSKNLVVLGISQDQNEIALKSFLSTNDKFGDHEIFDIDRKIGELYEVRAIPMLMLIDPNGAIIDSELRGEELQKAVERIK